MAKSIFFTFLLFVSLLVLSATLIIVAPYYYYNDIVNHNSMTDWFTISNYRKILVTPSSEKFDLKKASINEDLWNKFHFKTLEIPLPVKNPFYFVAPIIKYSKKQNNTEFGISLFNSKDTVLSQVYILPAITFPNVINSQKIFELPIVSNHILNRKTDQLWEDLFTKDISDWDISYSDMIYHLYILQLRSILINEKTTSYTYYKELGKAVLRLNYSDKDYVSDLVLSRRGSKIFSYMILTKKEDQEAKKIKYKMLHDISYLATTPSFTDHIYNEFKALPFQEQIDHKGMLYLLSAWSHSQSRLELIVSSIQYLERGRRNERQLEPLYDYIYRRVGKTFSRRNVGDLNLDPEVLLKRNIELEEMLKKKMIDEVKTPEKTLSVKEEYEKILEDTKNTIKKNKNTIIMN